MSGIFKKCQCLGQEDFTPNSSYNLTTNLSNVTNANILAISSSSNKHIISAGNKLKLELQHQGLEDLPSYYLLYDRVLEELHLESNNLVAIPKIIAYFTHLRYLNLAENEINVLNSSLGELKHLSELDVSKNNVTCVHDAVAKCNNLKILNFSVNPLKILPDPISKLESLTQLYLNETQLDDIPEALGNLNKLKILELRENNLTSLPKSLCMMTLLERLDIGNNNFTELPDVIGTLFSLKELWCDLNELTTIPSFIGCLKSLECLDACRNKIFSISNDVSGCSMLTDLHVSFNHLKEIPESLCQLNRLEMVKIDSNQLTKLPDRPLNSERIVELILTNNCLAKLPSWISRLKQMHILNIDDNLLDELPKEIGECSSLSILSCRNNRLNRLPDELGSLTNLKVLNLCDNKLKRLPITLLKLTNITALWLAKNQAIPLIPLQVDYDVAIKKQYLTCVLLPQKETEEPSLASTEDNKDGTLTTEDGSKDSVCNKKLKSRVTFDLIANGPNGNGIWERLNNKFIKDRVASSELAVGPKLNSTAAPRTELKSILNFPKMSSNIALNPSIIASNGIDFTQEKTMTQSNTPLNNMFNNNDNNWNTENTKYTSKLNYDESYDLSHFINGGQQQQQKQQYEIRNNNFKTSYQAPSSLSLQGQASHQSAVPPIITYNLSNSSGYSSDGEITRHNISTMINNSIINNNNSDNVNGNYLDSHLINGNYVTNNNATSKLLSSNGLKVECSECRKKIHYTVTLGNNPQRLADIEERSEKASPLKLQLSPKSSSDHQMLIDNGKTKENLSHLSTGPINNWHTQQQKVVKPPYIRNSLTITDISEYTNHLAKPLFSNTSSVHARFAHHLEQRGGQNNLGGNIHCNIGKNEGNAIHSNYDLFNYEKMGTSSSNRVDDKAFILNKFLADGNTGNNSKNNQSCIKIHNGMIDKTKPIHHSSRVRILDPISQGNINSNNNVNNASILSPPALRGYHSDSERIKLEKRALIGQSINERIQQLQLANMNKEMPPIRRSNSFKNDRIDFVTFLGPHGNNGGQSNLQTGDICHGRSLSYSYQPNLYDSRYVPTALTCLQEVIRESHEPFQDSYKNDKSDKYLQHAAKYPHKKCLLHKHQETLKECPLHAKKCNKNNFNTTTAFRPDSSSSNTSSSQGCKDNSCSGPPNNHPINITNVTVKKSFRDRFSFLKHKKKDMDKAKIDKRGKCKVNTTTEPHILTSKNKDMFLQQQSCAKIQKLQSPLIKSRKKCPIHSKEYRIDPKMIDKLNKCDYHTGEIEDEMNLYIPRAVDITPDFIIGRDQQNHNYDPNNKNSYGNMMEESVSIKHEYQSGIILDILLAKRQNELGFSIIGGNTGVYAENEGNTNGKNKMCTHHLTENNLGTKNNPKNLNLNGIRVNKILHNGPADKSLIPGDLILAVNGINFDDMEHENAVKVLKATGNIVKLTIFRNNTC